MFLNNSSRGLLKENEKILFIRYNINGEIFYSLPGGSLEIGESLIECVIREFSEETGIEIEVGDLILLNEFISHTPNSISERWKNGIHQIESIFKVKRKVIEYSGKIHIENRDLGMEGLEWLSNSELSDVKYYPEMPIEWFFTEKQEIMNIYQTKRYE